jgi:NADH:ubiquinone oxidoreductase subunit 5 (subunit L)/multisubunit Na+/H+ antiporter MnhA subunit
MIFLPFFAAALLGALSLAVGSHTEQRTTAIVSTAMLSTIACGLLNLWVMASSPDVAFDMFTWHQFGHESFTFELLNSWTDAVYACCYMIIVGIVGRFSITYLHREQGFFTYYYLFLLFVGATNLVIFSANFPSLLVGWELVGICSVLLIGFYHHRSGPLDNSLFTFATYRIGEACLLLAVTIAHTTTGSSSFSIFSLHQPANHGILALVLCAIYVKSAQWPFSLWLPRAMEGPTPSSALLYGGISTHMGPMLLIKLMPYLGTYPWVNSLVLSASAITVLFASGVGRTRCDAKTQVAYATIGQLGVIFFEIGMGWYNLAFFHSISHCALRTFQFLKTPSLLAEFTHLQVAPTDFYLERLLPLSLRRMVYYATFSKFFLEPMVEKLMVRPFFFLASLIMDLEERLSGHSASFTTEGEDENQLRTAAKERYVITRRV